MSFARAGAVYAAANVVSALLPFLLLPLLTRALGPVEYGQVISFALIMTLCGTIAGMNVHGAMGMIWFRKPADEVPSYVGSAMALAVASALLVAPFVMLILYLAPGAGSGLSPIWGAAAALAAAANIILQTRLVLWQSQHRPLLSGALQVCASLLNFTLSLAGVFALHLGAAGRNGGLALSTGLVALMCLATFVAAGEIRWRPRRAQIVTLISFGAPLILHGFGAVLLSTADRWAVSIKLDAAALGIYGAGAQLGMLMSIVGDAFVKAFSPWLYGKLKSNTVEDQLFAVGAVYGSIPAFLLIAFGLGVFLHLTSGIILGPRYHEATAILPWFMVGGAFSGVYLCTAGLYFYAARTGLLAAVSLSAGSAGAICTWFLVSAFDLQGAAMGFALTQVLLAAGSTMVAFRTFDLPWSSPRAALETWGGSLVAPLRRR